MTALKLANPEWLLLLLALLPVLALRVRAHFLARRGLPGLVSPKLRGHLISGTGSLWRWLRFGLGSIAIALIAFALARPQWGVEKIEAQSQGRNVLIAIDTSRSMMANDVTPDRLTRAKLAAQDIVNALPNDRIGLIAFSGTAFVQAPLTIDHAAVNETLQQFDTALIPRGGTNLSSAVSLAIDTFRKADIGESALIIFSDGEDLEGGEELVRLRGEAAGAGMTIVAIAVGTESGSIIPDPEANQPGVFVKDDNGQIVRSRLNPLALQKISAEAENGLFLMLDGRRSIASVVAASLSQLEATAQDEIARERPIERFPVFLGLGLLFMVAAWLLPDFRKRRRSVSTRPKPPGALTKTKRSMVAEPAGSGHATDLPPPPPQPIKASKKAAAVSVILLLFVLPLADAQQAGNDAAKPTEQSSPVEIDGRAAAEMAMAALQKQDYAAALKNYQRALTDKSLIDQSPELNLGRGSAAYKLGDFEQAKQAFGKVLESPDDQLAARGEYNLANTLFRHGETFLNAEVGAPNPKAAEEQWDTALEHYRGALKLDPGNERARHNAEVVEQRLAELRKQQEQQEPPKSEDEDPPPPEEEEDDEEEDDDEEEEDEEEEEKDQDDKDDKQNQGNENNKNQDNQGDGQDQNENQDPNGSQNPDSNPESNDQSPEGNDDQQPPGGEQPPGGDQGDQGQQPPGGQPPSPDGSGDDQKSDQEKNPQPPGAQPQSPDGQPQKPEGGDGKQDQQSGSPRQQQPQSSQASPQSAGADGQQEEAQPTPEGDLKADPASQSQAANSSPGQRQQAQAGEAEGREGDPNANVMNAETGFTPSEARRLLNTQSEEALRMMRVRVPSGQKGYRNW